MTTPETNSEREQNTDYDSKTVSHIATDGGTYTAGDVVAGGNFVGRDLIYNPPAPNPTSLAKEIFQGLVSLLKQNYWFLISFVAPQIILTISFFLYRDRYLISWWAYLVTSLLLAFVILSWWNVKRKLSSRGSQVLASILTVFWGGCIYFQAQSLLAPPEMAPDKFGIAVAAFSDGPDNRITGRARELSNILLNELNGVIAKTPGLAENIELRPIGIIEGPEQGKEEGKRLGAELLLWGHIVEEKEDVYVYFEVLEVTGFSDDPAIPDTAFPRVLPVVRPNLDNGIKISASDLMAVVRQQSLGLTAFCLGLYYYLDEQRPSQAAKQFELALDFLSGTKQPDAKVNLGIIHYYLGKSYQLEGKYEQSQEEIRKAIELNPKDPAFILGQAYNYGVLGDVEKKRTAAEQVIKLTDQSPKDEVVIYDRALAYEALDDDENAWRQYNDILKCDRNFSKCDSQLFIVYLSAARVLVRLNRLEFARALYEKAEKLVQANTDKQVWLSIDRGKFYEKDNKLDKAIQSYTKAIELNPNLVTPYICRARLYGQMQSTDSAVLDYRKAIELSDNKAFAHITFAGFLYQLELYVESIEEYRQGLRYSPHDKALIHAYIGQSFAALSEKQQALEEFRQAIEIPSPSESYIRGIYGRTLAQFEDFNGAIAQMEQSLKLNSNVDIETSLNLGQLYECSEKVDKAKTLYHSLLKLSELPESKREIIQTRLDNLQAETTLQPCLASQSIAAMVYGD